jgi:hypothetical protein
MTASQNAIFIADQRRGAEIRNMERREDDLRRTAEGPVSPSYMTTPEYRRWKADLLDGADQMHEATLKLAGLEGDELAARFGRGEV